MPICNESEVPCKGNPCQGILSPQALGYDSYYSSSTNLEFQINMEAVSVALAVNMGLLKLNALVQIPGDTSRVSLLNKMVDAGHISLSQANHTSSYYDSRNLPASPIYCYSENPPTADKDPSWESGKVFCLVRIGNMLTYPITTDFGWTTKDDGKFHFFFNFILLFEIYI